MKYIRTKDGKIFDLGSKEVLSWEYVDDDTAINEYGVEGAFYEIYFLDKNECCRTFIEEKDILVQTDTLEELCDGFYIDDKLLNRFNKYAVFEKDEFPKVKELFASYTKGKIPAVVYAFIKTSKGLIYVAKMNEKGELELI